MALQHKTEAQELIDVSISRVDGIVVTLKRSGREHARVVERGAPHLPSLSERP